MQEPLEAADYRQLVNCIATLEEFAGVYGRNAFLNEVFAGSSRKNDIIGQINLDGPRNVAAGSVVNVLKNFGQVVYGQEALALLIKTLLTRYGGSAEEEFLNGLFKKYPLEGTGPTVVPRLADNEWKSGPEDYGKIKEALIGENTLQDIRTIELAWIASKSVAHLNVPARESADGGQGTGFIIAPGVLMTNNHVLSLPDQIGETVVSFNYQMLANGQPAVPDIAKLVPGGAFYTNADDSLDFTVVEIENVPAYAAPLRVNSKLLKKDARIPIIQHPEGKPKQIALHNSYIAYADNRIVQYYTTTQKGSSGSPCFNDDFELVALHHAGGQILEPGTNRRYFRNEGISIDAILRDIQANAPEIYKRITESRPN